MRLRTLTAWLVHIVTALGAVAGLFALQAISQQQYITAFWLMGLAILIDGVDGTFARFLNVEVAVPKIDGSLLDNITDYLNYAVVPAFFLLNSEIIAPNLHLWVAGIIVVVSAYQFCQIDAKTEDYYFKGFPCYWNIVVFYLYLLNVDQTLNLLLLLVLAAGIFVPIKYIYPTRLQYFSKHAWIRGVMLFSIIAWGAITFFLLWSYPDINLWLMAIAMGYMVVYILLSLYKTINP